MVKLKSSIELILQAKMSIKKKPYQMRLMVLVFILYQPDQVHLYDQQDVLKGKAIHSHG